MMIEAPEPSNPAAVSESRLSRPGTCCFTSLP